MLPKSGPSPYQHLVGTRRCVSPKTQVNPKDACPLLLNLDPRYYQIAALALLLLFGLLRLRFDIQLPQALLILGTVIVAQFVCTRIWKLEKFDPRSALISGLSLCLLARTNSLLLAVITGAVTILSKFVLRWRGKHIFNPTNVGIVLMILLTGGSVWVSPGQWGDFAFFAFLVICLGGLVVNRAGRADVTLAFLGAWTVLLFGRSFWLGEPTTIPLHRLQNGALLIFAFFMISDPRTTPNSRAGRILFAVLIAVGGAFVQFKLFRTNGLLWSLAALSLLVPVIDLVLPGEKYHWQRTAPKLAMTETKVRKGIAYEPA